MFRSIIPAALAAVLVSGAAFADGGGVAAPVHQPGAKAKPVTELGLSSAQIAQLAEEAGITPDQAKSMTLSDLAKLKESRDS